MISYLRKPPRIRAESYVPGKESHLIEWIEDVKVKVSDRVEGSPVESQSILILESNFIFFYFVYL